MDVARRGAELSGNCFQFVCGIRQARQARLLGPATQQETSTL
jgi:hypothetical protein